MGQYLRSCFRLSTLLLRVSQDTSLMRTNASSSCMHFTDRMLELGSRSALQHRPAQGEEHPLTRPPQNGQHKSNGSHPNKKISHLAEPDV